MADHGDIRFGAQLTFPRKVVSSEWPRHLSSQASLRVREWRLSNVGIRVGALRSLAAGYVPHDLPFPNTLASNPSIGRSSKT
jgi:hypothetical protein